MSRFGQRRSVICQQLVELVTDYLEGELHPDQRTAVEAHLAHCGPCAGYVQQVRRMLELTAGTLDEHAAIPPDVLAALTARYRQRR